MGLDDLDDLLNPDDALEAAFRELDAQVALDRMKGRKGPEPRPGKARRKGSKRASKPRTDDPLEDLKSAFDGAPARRYLVVVCPGCDAKNRVPLERLRAELPVCGRCKTDLSFTR